MNLRQVLPVCLVASMTMLVGCGGSAESDRQLGDKQEVLSDNNHQLVSARDTPIENPAVQIKDESGLSAVVGASEIPYSVYPNGSKYRVGGENGLKIVVFQTEDSFNEVDNYYKVLSEKSGMPRLTAMNDYVRYSSSPDDKDPWATYRPGIVIHQFNNNGERLAVGAKDSAQTNIIMSF